MKGLQRHERGQAVVEFALIAVALLMLTAGLVDVGRGFFQYNAVASMARYGARWGAVVGGTCVGQPGDAPTNDWCNQLGTAGSGIGSNFWTETGSVPKQGYPTSSTDTSWQCPRKEDSSSFTSADVTKYYYTVGSFTGGSNSSIVGAIAQRYDTDASSYNKIGGGLSPGFDLSKLYVCIQLTPNNTDTGWLTNVGYPVQVWVYYEFKPVNALLAKASIYLVSSSQYVIE